MNKSKLFIDKFGNLTALCDNHIDNTPDLGKKTIKREAFINFNNERQVWEITDTDGTLMAECQRRDQAVQLERYIVNSRLAKELSK